MNTTEADSFKKWKTVIPLLYDWFANHNLTWPSLTCRWGPKLDESTYKKKYRLYFSEQTDGTDPQRITIATADVCKPRVASAESITSWSEMQKCPYIKVEKSIVHPGEVNKLRDCPLHPNIIVTHTDAPELYVWNLKRQPNRNENKKDTSQSVADMILTGHEENAEYALGMSSINTRVASGGKDKKVLVWDLQDHVTDLVASAPSESGRSGGSSTSDPNADSKQRTSTRLNSQIRLCGHEDTIEDVVFKPHSSDELASVGDDYQLLLWDTRSGESPVGKVPFAHGRHDIHCVDWSAKDDFIATGCADGSLKIWDRRMMGSAEDCVHSFKFHKKAVMRVEWSPHQEGVLASGGDDHVICVWDLRQRSTKAVDAQEVKRLKRSIPQELLFQHVGHRSVVVDFQWNADDPWTMLSVSDDVSADSGGGTLQMWRMNDLIYRPECEVLKELEEHRQYILTGKSGAKKEENDESMLGETPAPKAESIVKEDKPQEEPEAGIEDTVVAEATVVADGEGNAVPREAEPDMQEDRTDAPAANQPPEDNADDKMQVDDVTPKEEVRNDPEVPPPPPESGAAPPAAEAQAEAVMVNSQTNEQHMQEGGL